MDRWEKLYRTFNRIESEEHKRSQKQKREADERREFDSWCTKVTKEVMEAIHDAAKRRAREFKDRTGQLIRIEYPSHRPVKFGTKGPFMSFLRISMNEEHIDVYSHRDPGTAPFLHLVKMARRTRGKTVHSSLVSFPGCTVAKAVDGAFQLWRAVPDRDHDVELLEELTIDEFVFQAFELLIGLRKKGRKVKS